MKKLTSDDISRIMALSAACEAAQAKELSERRAKAEAAAAERKRLFAEIGDLLQENEKLLREIEEEEEGE